MSTRAERQARSQAVAAERDRITTLLAAARERGAGPRMPRDAKVAVAVELSRGGCTNRQIGDLLGQVRETIRVWVNAAEAAEKAV